MSITTWITNKMERFVDGLIAPSPRLETQHANTERSIAVVIPHIFIGSIASADPHHVETKNIHTIINLSGVSYKHHYSDHVDQFQIDMEDTDVVASTARAYMTKFQNGVAIIKASRARGDNVLIHCAAGINRSATLIGMYLLASGATLTQMYTLLSQANDQRQLPVLTNRSFRALLRAYEEAVRSQK